jgi:hypothetical protein
VDVHAAHFAAVVTTTVDQLTRNDAFGEDPFLVIDVAEKQIDRREPLRQASLDRRPLAGRDDAGSRS